MQAFDKLEKNVQQLLLSHKQLQKELHVLRKLTTDQQNIIANLNQEVSKLSNQNKALKMSLGMMGNEEQRQQAKQQINLLIQRIDHVIGKINDM